MRPSSVLVALSCVASAAACGDDDVTGGTPADAGPDVTVDGATDAGVDSPPNGGDSGGGDAPTDSSTNLPLGAGPYSLVYVGTTVGIDMRSVPDGKATFDGSKLTGYEVSTDERPTLGTAQVSEPNGDAFALLGRWSGGITAGKFYATDGTGFITLPANGGFHYVIVKPADPIPSSGATSYTLLHKTAATLADGSAAVGTITGSLSANLAGASTKIGFSVTLDVGGVAYTAETTGGTANPATSESGLQATVKGGFFANSVPVTAASGPCATPGTCTAGTRGAIAGANGERIGLVLTLATGTSTPRAIGAVLFQK